MGGGGGAEGHSSVTSRGKLVVSVYSACPCMQNVIIFYYCYMRNLLFTPTIYIGYTIAEITSSMLSL